MSSRSADSTIKGYYYQFNKTIDELLNLTNDNEHVIIEGIEDIDVNCISEINYVQCKYYSASSLTDSAIREPVILMINHYLEIRTRRNDLKYTLFGYFKNEKEERTVIYNLEEIKNVLTYKKDKKEIKYFELNSISDDDLSAFIKLFTVKISKEFDTYQKTIVSQLKTKFHCSDFEAENYYLNNSLRVVLDKAIQKTEAERLITKKEFISNIDCSKTLFFGWFRKYRDHENYIFQIKKRVKELNLFTVSKEKMIILGNQIEFANSSMPLDSFIIDSADLYFKVNKSFYDAKPLTIVIDINNEQIAELKKNLIKNRIKFNDGHEGYHFCFQTFCENPIITRRANGTRISKASFQLRVITLKTLKTNYNNLNKQFSILFISEDASDIPNHLCSQLLEVKYLTDLKDIYNVIKN